MIPLYDCPSYRKIVSCHKMGKELKHEAKIILKYQSDIIFVLRYHYPEYVHYAFTEIISNICYMSFCTASISLVHMTKLIDNMVNYQIHQNVL